MTKRRGLGVIFIAAVLVIALLTYFVLNIFFSPYWDSIYPPVGYFSAASFQEAKSDALTYTKDQACEDIDYIVKRIGRTHPLCSQGVTSEISECAEREKESFGEKVTAYEVWRAASRVMHKLNDSNSFVVPSFPMNYLKTHREMLKIGYELSAINNISIEDIFAENKEFVSFELDSWGINVIKGLACTREGLKFLGISPDSAEFTYSKYGSTVVKSFSQNDYYNYQAMHADKETPDAPYRSDIYKESSAAVLTLNECVYDIDFKQFMYDFFTDVGESSVRSVIIDLRDSRDGTSQVLDELLMYTDHESFTTPAGQWRLGMYMMNWNAENVKIVQMDVETIFDGDIYVLTSSDTFGSATLIAEILQDNGFAVVIGEPCGNMPDGYGEVVVFQTPNSLLTFQVSSKHFERIDRGKAGEPLIPDIGTSKSEALQTALDIANKNNDN